MEVGLDLEASTVDVFGLGEVLLRGAVGLR